VKEDRPDNDSIILKKHEDTKFLHLANLITNKTRGIEAYRFWQAQTGGFNSSNSLE
jgi:hypothetical protein